MIIKTAIYTYLTQVTALAALVGNRIYPSLKPPASGFSVRSIAYARIGDDADYTHDGKSRLCRPRFQFNCYAESDLMAEAIAIELKKAMENFKGTWSTIKVSKAFYTGGSDAFATSNENFIVACDFEIQHY